MWINDTSYAVRRIEAGIAKGANLNFVQGFSVRQEYSEVRKKVWMLTRDELVVDLNIIVTFFAIVGGLAQLIFTYNFFYSIYRGPKAVQNPWKSNTLEWTTPVEHLHGNWPGPLPVVHRWPYDYSKPGKAEDWVSQITPLEEGEEEH